MNIVFFGSFQHYSTLILKSLVKHPDIFVSAVVSTPPKPSGREKILTQTHTHQWAESHRIPVFTPETLNQNTLNKTVERWKLIIENSKNISIDMFLVAGYSKLLPTSWLKLPTHGSLNLHFSLLPKYRGANPAEWAILLGEKGTGITLIKMGQDFDTGQIITQKQIPIDPQDNRKSLYEKLYHLGVQELPRMLIKYCQWLQKTNFTCQTSLTPKPQPQKSPTPIALQFKRQDGFIPWQLITSTIEDKPIDPTNHLQSHLLTAWKFLKTQSPDSRLQTTKFIERAIRALYDYPGVWTIVNTKKGQKRLKIHSTTIKNQKLILNQVQLEGLKPTPFNQIKNQIIP